MAPSFSSKVVMVLVMSLFYTLKTLEILVNPNTSTVVCGTDDDCAVICNVEQSCLSKTFYFYNNAIYLECSATYACEDITIYSANTKLLNINATDAYALVSGKLFSSVTDTDITVTCGFSACENAIFYYLNNGESKHMCTSNLSCRKTVIKAVSTVSLFCDTSRSCYRTSFILPTDNASHQQSSLTVTDGGAPSDHTIKLLSLYPFINFISTDGSTLNGIHFVFGARFDEYCIVSDQSCMDSVQNKISEYDNLTIIDTYVDGFESLQANYTGDLLIFLTKNHSNIFEPPSISYTNVLSIVCIYCTDVIFLLEHIQNAVLSVGGTRSWRMKIYGSRDVFTLNVMHFVGDNEYFLNNTNTIEVNSLGSHSEIHLGNALDVHINCQTEGNLYYPCPSGDNAINLWSTLHENEIRLATSTTEYWNIDTASQILIHFDFEQYPCEYQNYSSNCTFLTISPTRNPTESSPSSEPSLSRTNIVPSSAPTSDSANTLLPTMQTVPLNTSHISVITVVTVLTKASLTTMDTSIIISDIVADDNVAVPVMDFIDEETQFILIIIIGIITLCVIGICMFCCSHKGMPNPPAVKSANEVRQDDGNKTVKMAETDTMTRQFSVIQIASTPDIMDKRLNQKALEVQYWLDNVVKLPVYYDILVQNGYESLQIIREITSITELDDIGIKYKAHQKKIFEEIEELKHDDYRGNRIVSVDIMMRTVEGDQMNVPAGYHPGQNRKREGSNYGNTKTTSTLGNTNITDR